MNKAGLEDELQLSINELEAKEAELQKKISELKQHLLELQEIEVKNEHVNPGMEQEIVRLVNELSTPSSNMANGNHQNEPLASALIIQR